ncbi:hypothetical protein NDU88_005400 [Pleurodeles waltl]|uniref:Uncharacterized protein n=1 Tax=Pleurodeles waltl TaxID=8319 RepID=A0AAV7UIV9_PLEWA|nr:hypothetical protein NDU88_005400 [Pleurodeles waltl]
MGVLVAGWDALCSRLSDNPAPGIPESGTVFHSCCGDDASLRYHGNGEAGNRLGNPDIRVPDRTEKEDGLRARGAEEEENAVGDERKGDEETKDLKSNGNSKDSLETNGQPRAGRRAEGRDLCHVPGGMWLTKGACRETPLPQCVLGIQCRCVVPDNKCHRVALQYSSPGASTVSQDCRNKVLQSSPLPLSVAIAHVRRQVAPCRPWVGNLGQEPPISARGCLAPRRSPRPRQHHQAPRFKIKNINFLNYNKGEDDE